MSDLVKQDSLDVGADIPAAEGSLESKTEAPVSTVASLAAAADESLREIELEELQRFEEALKPREGKKTTAELFSGMNAEQKLAALRTHHVRQMTGVGQNHPFFVDESKVPDNIHLHWISYKAEEHLGMRGYSKVPVSKQTLSWVPNIRTTGGKRWIEHANYVLCWIPMDIYFEQRVREFRTVEGAVAEHGRQFKSALKSAAGQLGLSAQKAAELDRTEGTGLIATRGLDPGSPNAIDAVEGEGEG